MTQDEIDLAIAQYKDSIKKLHAYVAKETDDANADAAFDRITEYRDMIIDSAWEGIVSSTPRLNELVSQLRTIADGASKHASLAEVIGDIRGHADKVAKLSGGKEIQCKTAGCAEKVVYLPNALAAIAAVGGVKKIKLTCKKLHTNEYEIAAP
jgi:hypothetical protein